MRHCRHCGVNLAEVPRTDAMTKHIVGICTPSHNDVESAIAQLEIEEEREKEAIRKFWARERQRAVLSQGALWRAAILSGILLLVLVALGLWG